MVARAWIASAAAVLGAMAGASRAAEIAADVAVYGGTSAGVMAAVEAARGGKKVVLVEPGHHLGGLTSGGLGWTDVGQPGTVGGLAREFYHRIYLAYQDNAAWKAGTREQFAGARGQGARAVDGQREMMWVFEPHVAEKVFDEMVKSSDVRVLWNARLRLDGGVEKEGARIAVIHLENGDDVRAKVYVDASYEGDLMARAGVRYAVGREANATYGETINGLQVAGAVKNQLPAGVDAYLTPGNPASGLLPGVNALPADPDGSADERIQAYCYRMCLTDVPANRVMIEKPAGYDERRYELLFRAIEAGQKGGFFKLDLMPNRKTDSNNEGGISTDLIGENYAYPEADHAGRARIASEHEAWQRGLVWALQNHPRVPREVREKYAKWGLPKDEFADNRNWPTQLYVREARRMIGAAMATQRTLADDAGAARSVGLGSYAMDSHNVQRYVDRDGHVRNEGDVQVRPKHPYAIDYGVITPRAEECANLIVPVCLSASHVAYGSIRMEPAFMVLGHSAGAAAAQAIDEGVGVQAVDYARLSGRLTGEGQVLRWTPEPGR